MKRLLSDMLLAGKLLVTSAAAFGGFACAVAPHPGAIAVWLGCCVLSYFIVRGEYR